MSSRMRPPLGHSRGDETTSGACVVNGRTRGESPRRLCRAAEGRNVSDSHVLRGPGPGPYSPPPVQAQERLLNIDIRTLTERVREESAFVDLLSAEAGKVIVGQRQMVERVLIGLLSNGHVLLEGVPGLAKTLTVRTFADGISARFQRIQFTPDLLPADLVGTMIYNQQSGEFTVRHGPIFANVILADEINRAPAKVQSALLEAMQERQVTIGEHSYALPS